MLIKRGDILIENIRLVTYDEVAENENRRTVTDTQIADWNGKAEGNHGHTGMVTTNGPRNIAHVAVVAAESEFANIANSTIILLLE